ncbi:MAG: YbjN domain-containing protein [Clostridia bacterium]|nr:YbjN domain-containing protein [Clostridia bacterium]
MLKCAQLFTALLEEKNFNYDPRESDDASVVVFPYEGKRFTCIFTGEKGEYLSLYVTYETIPQDKYADVLILCNELNAKFKWVKCYIDKDNDFCIQDDAILSESTAADETFELLLRLISISGDIKAPLMRAIYA